MRAPSAAGLLRIAGLAGTVTGCALVIASLSSAWAVDGPSTGQAGDETGWQFMAYGDLLLVGACVMVVVLAVALCVGPRSRRVSRTAGGAAVALLIAGLGGVALLWWLTSLDVSLISSDDQAQRFDPGPGFEDAVTGLLVAVVGTVVLLAGRWETHPRRSRHGGDAPPPTSREPSWLSPG